ncbi:Putative aminoacrylate hydrolase RutD [Paraglaciecola mesophila]|uniref:Aminoacrylate hydrolase RutD n=1 Tax=Paraglaciecola mesophila TaxID=197222 RepID=A0A857JGV2_9ALTE|nr:alpha/beta hydrolase [Paraglaciecola mesophila]QHJ10492.1 Putative aminoacrylate hydrolase RutD [Paraglaciecola mesophila]
MTNLLFLPGTLCNSAVFSNQITTLTNAGHRCITLEYGEHDNLNHVAEHALSLFAAHEQFSICAFSMGGMVAFELLTRCPERIDRIALLDSNAHADKPQGRTVRNEHLNYAVEHGLDRLIHDYFSSVYLSSPNDEIMGLIAKMAKDTGIARYKAQLEILATRPDASELLANCSHRMLIMGGCDDVLCPPTEQQRMHQLAANSELVLIKHAGHFAPLEQSDKVNLHLYNFFGGAAHA